MHIDLYVGVCVSSVQCPVRSSMISVWDSSSVIEPALIAGMGHFLDWPIGKTEDCLSFTFKDNN